MSLEDLENDLENWEPKTPDVNLEGWKKHAFLPDKRAEERRAMCEDAWSRRFECPSCGILKNITATFTGDEWHYYGQCSQCGTDWANAYYLVRKCEACGKKVPMTSRNPEGKCKCEGETPRRF